MISKQTLERTIIRSMQTANREYNSLTGGDEWLSDRGVEPYAAYFVSRGLKQQLRKHGGGSVFLEVSLAQLLRYALKDKAGGEIPLRLSGPRGKHLYGGNRIDILVTDRDFNAVGLIELKREAFSFLGWQKDIDRLVMLLSRLAPISKLRFGCFAMFITEPLHSGYIEECLSTLSKYVGAKCRGPSSPRFAQFKTFYSKYKLFDGVKYRFAIAGFCFTLQNGASRGSKKRRRRTSDDFQ